MAKVTDGSGKRKRLGRGLSSLIGDMPPVKIQTETKTKQAHKADRLKDNTTPGEAGSAGGRDGGGVGGGQVVMIDVERVRPNRYQPRQQMDESKLQSLADSILQDGVMQPILVRDDAGGEGYELIAGERRWRAAKLAGLTTVPGLIRNVKDEAAAAWAMIENIHREDLNAIDRAIALSEMIKRFHLTQFDLATRVGMERSTVANLVRLLELAEPIREMIAAGKLSAGHGKALLGCADEQLRYTLAQQVVEEAWSVRQLEREVKGIDADSVGVIEQGTAGGEEGAGGEGGEGGTRQAVVEDLEKRLSEKLGTKVRITTNRQGNKGKMMISFYSLDHFDDLLSKIGLSPES